MLLISEATIKDIKLIREIAYRSWPATYGSILSKEQIDYMLNLFYSDASLSDNFIEKGHQFILVHEDGRCIGFASYEHNYLDKNGTRLHKIYLLPEAQGKGAGKLMLDSVERLALENHSVAISLNVNRFNNALAFYQKAGFKVVSEVDIELDFGYLMEDYVMEKEL
jgi:GNAT superfamily N-acetyltransferase